MQAFGIVAYCFLIGVFFWNADAVLGQTDTFLSPIVFLLLLSVSILVCGILVFLKPYKLFVAGKTKEALGVVISTAASLFVFLILSFLGMLLFR